MSRDPGRLPRGKQLDWLAAANAIAVDLNPGLDPGWVARELKGLARPLSADLLRSLPPADQGQLLADYLGRRVGLTGNASDYDDPRNSLIDEVLRRKLGIPISLALVYVEVGRHVGLDVVGIAFPGHFLVQVRDMQRTAGLDRSVFVDPFAACVLADADLELLAEQATGSAEVDPRWLEPAGTRAIVMRMLANLRAAYARSADERRLLLVLQRMCELEDNPVALLRDRGLLHGRLGAPRAALADLEEYLVRLPQASDAQQVQELMDELSDRLHRAGGPSSLN